MWLCSPTEEQHVLRPLLVAARRRGTARPKAARIEHAGYGGCTDAKRRRIGTTKRHLAPRKVSAGRLGANMVERLSPALMLPMPALRQTAVRLPALLRAVVGSGLPGSGARRTASWSTGALRYVLGFVLCSAD